MSIEQRSLNTRTGVDAATHSIAAEGFAATPWSRLDLGMRKSMRDVRGTTTGRRARTRSAIGAVPESDSLTDGTKRTARNEIHSARPIHGPRLLPSGSVERLKRGEGQRGRPEQRGEPLDAAPKLQNLQPQFLLRKVALVQTDQDRGCPAPAACS
jgi:hypothetical protein